MFLYITKFFCTLSFLIRKESMLRAFYCTRMCSWLSQLTNEEMRPRKASVGRLEKLFT